MAKGYDFDNNADMEKLSGNDPQTAVTGTDAVGTHDVQETHDPDTAEQNQEKANQLAETEKLIEFEVKVALNLAEISLGHVFTNKDIADNAKRLTTYKGQTGKNYINALISEMAESKGVGSLKPDVSKSFDNEDYGQIYPESLYAQFMDYLEPGILAKAASPDTITDRHILCYMSVFYYFAANYENVRPMDSKRLTKTGQTEITRIHKSLLFYFESREIKDIRSAVYPLGAKQFAPKALHDWCYIPVTLEFLRFLHDFSESEKAKGNRYIPPKHYVQPNNKLANIMTSDTVNDAILKSTPLAPNVFGNKTNMPYILFSLSENDKLRFSRPFDEYDRCINNAICSIWEAGNKAFTLEQLYRVMTNKQKTQYVSVSTQRELVAHIEKMSVTRVYADLTNELRVRKGTDLQPGEKKIIADNLLHTKGAAQRLGGHTVMVYQLIDEPFLLQYAKVVNQLITVPSRVLTICEVKDGQITEQEAKNSELLIILRDYLIRRIKWACNKSGEKKKAYEKKYRNIDRKQPPEEMDQAKRALATELAKLRRVTYDDLYEKSDNVNATRNKQYEIRKLAATILTNFKSNGLVKDFKINKKDKCFDLTL